MALKFLLTTFVVAYRLSTIAIAHSIPTQQAFGDELVVGSTFNVASYNIDHLCSELYKEPINGKSPTDVIKDELNIGVTMAMKASEAFNAGRSAFDGPYAKAFWPDLDDWKTDDIALYAKRYFARMARATKAEEQDKDGPIRHLEISCDPNQIDPGSKENICKDRIAATQSDDHVYRITLCPAFFDVVPEPKFRLPTTSEVAKIGCDPHTLLYKYNCKGE